MVWPQISPLSTPSVSSLALSKRRADWYYWRRANFGLQKKMDCEVLNQKGVNYNFVQTIDWISLSFWMSGFHYTIEKKVLKPSNQLLRSQTERGVTKKSHGARSTSLFLRYFEMFLDTQIIPNLHMPHPNIYTSHSNDL